MCSLTVAALQTNACEERRKTAFLYRELGKGIYMNQSQCYIKPGNENNIFKLKRAVYFLEQAAEKQMDIFLQKMGLNKVGRSMLIYEN